MAISSGAAIAWAGSLSAGEVTAGAALAGTAISAGVALSAKSPKIPASPVLQQNQVDQGEQQAQQDALRRQSIAGGMNSSVGTSGGQSGQMLNPSTMGQKTLLGQ